MATAVALPPPPARTMQEPAGPEPPCLTLSERGGNRFPPCLSPPGELPWGTVRGRRPPRPPSPASSSLRAFTPPPVARHGFAEVSRSLAWQLGGPGPTGQREEEPAAEPFPPTRRAAVDEGTVPSSPTQPGILKFGLLPPELHARLLDQEDYKNRTQAVEELKKVVGSASQAVVTSMPATNLLGLISFLYTLLDDSNFKVVLGALEVIHLLAWRLGDQVQAFLAPLVSAAAKVLGDNKLAIRQEYSRLFLQLMKAAGPQQVLGLLLQQEYLQHKNSKVREEVVNICIVALLTYSGEELDLAKLAFGLAPALVDSKRRVRHAAMEAFAVLASSMGPGKTALLFKAVDAVELEDSGDGVVHAVQARLARKTLPKLGDQGFVEYAVPLPSSAHSRGSCFPPGADTDWLLMGSRTQSAHSYCGYHVRDDALQSSSPHAACADPGVSPRRVLSAGKGKNKLPWENEHAGEKEGGSGVKMPCIKAEEQFPTSNDLLHPPKSKPSQGAAASEELFFSRKKPSRNLLQNSVDFNSQHSPVCAGAGGSHQPQIAGRCGTLGCTQLRGKSGSVDSELQLLGLNSCQQDKVFSSLNFSSKTQRGFCNQAQQTTSFQGPSASQGTFLLPSYPLSSVRNSPKHVPSPGDSPKKSGENTMSFSNSWPLKSFEGLPKPSSQKQLLCPKPGDNAGEDLQEKHSALELKPTLLRGPSSCRGLKGSRPVPPLPHLPSPLPDKVEFSLARWRHEECEAPWLNQVERKLAADLSELNVEDEEVDQEEMQNSLRSLRNSAAKKRAKLSSNAADLESPDSALTLELSGDSPSHGSSPSTGSCSESGVYSQESLTSPVSTLPHSRRKMSDTFPLLGSKSQPVRASSERSKDLNVAEQNSSTGLAESASCFPQMDSLEFISPSVLPEDAVVSVGVLGSPPPAEAHSQSIACALNGDEGAGREETEPSAGTWGRSIQNSAAHCHAESEREMKVVMSRSAQEKMRRRKQEPEPNCREQEGRDLEGKEENPWEGLKLKEAEKTTTEKFSLWGDILTPSRNVSVSLENVALTPSFRRGSSLKRRKCSALLDSDEVSPGTRGRYKDQTPSVTHSPEIMDPSELQPFLKPEGALTEALTLLADEDWEKKIEGLNFVRCLSAYHAAVVSTKLHETSLAVAQEVRNLRSGVSRAAVVCLGDLFTHLKRSMDQELDNTVKVLLHKAGESNTFIREEVDKALKAMVTNVTPARALCSLLNGGQSHLHSAVRRCTAQHLSDIVERMGAERILGGAKAVADRLCPAIARFVQDSSQQTRFYGRKMLCSMMAHPDFDRTLEKYVPAKDLAYLKESVASLREKGLGEMPLDTPSAKGRRSHASGVGHSRSSPTSRDALNVTDSRETSAGSEGSRKPAPRNALESEEHVKDILGLLSAKDFRDRISGIRQLLSDTENNPAFVLANIVKIFDAFKPRLHDSNSKVNQVALETMHKMIPLLKDNLSPVINMLIPAMVDNNLNSKNPGIYAAATNVIQALCQHLDNSLLLQPFCTKAQFLNGKAKQDMTEKLADLVTELYPRKPYAVEQKVLVVLWHLLGNMTNSGSLPGAGGNIRTATAKLAKALYAQMGQSLLTHAAAQPPHIRKSLEEFLEIAT